MSKTLFINIKELYGILPPEVKRLEGEMMDRVESLPNAFLLVEEGKIASFGKMENLSLDEMKGVEVVDLTGKRVMPAFCDSHTHIVYAKSREQEFMDKIAGLSYEEIAKRGGGILNSADVLRKTSEDELYRISCQRLEEMIEKGTGAMEIKSGYGLNLESELKMLRVIKRMKENYSVVIKSTFLGAHAVGREFAGRQQEYVDMVCREMIPAVASENLADYVDVFCDKGFFDVAQTAQILSAAAKYGIRPKIHANELDVSGGVQVGVDYGAVSVDHLERTTEVEMNYLKGTSTMPVMLPGASFFLGMPYGNAKEFIKSGLGVALASDYNPGSSPSGDMRFVWALGCIKMHLTPNQAFNAVTINGAYAMGAADKVGSITVGKEAKLIVTREIPSLGFIPYCHHTPFIGRMII